MLDSLARPNAREDPGLLLQAVRWNDRGDLPAIRFGGGIPDHRLGGVVPGGNNAVQGLTDDRIVGRLNDRREPGRNFLAPVLGIGPLVSSLPAPMSGTALLCLEQQSRQPGNASIRGGRKLMIAKAGRVDSVEFPVSESSQIRPGIRTLTLPGRRARVARCGRALP